MSKDIETVKIIGRISKNGKEYWQTAIKVEGQEQSEFIAVYLKKGVDRLNYLSKENKVDKRGNVYTLYEVNARNVYMPEDSNGKITKAIITK